MPGSRPRLSRRGGGHRRGASTSRVALASGEGLRVVIENRSAPPLADLAFVALLPLPALLTGCPSADRTRGAPRPAPPPFDSAAATLFHPPYDVASLPPQDTDSQGGARRSPRRSTDTLALACTTLRTEISARALHSAHGRRSHRPSEPAPRSIPRFWGHPHGWRARPLARRSLAGAASAWRTSASRDQIWPSLAVSSTQRQQGQSACLLDHGAGISETLALARAGPGPRGGDFVVEAASRRAWPARPPGPAGAFQVPSSFLRSYEFKLHAQLRGRQPGGA